MSDVASTFTSRPLADVFWFQEGPGVRKWQFFTEGIKLLNVANIEKQGRLNLAKTDRHLSVEEATGKYAHFLLDEGDLVIASSGISFDEDGLLRTRGAFVESEHLPLCLNTSTIRFKPKEGQSDLNFLRHWLNGLEFRTQITKLVTGSAQQNFGPTHLKALSISIPPLEEQRRIATILDQAETLRTQRRQALAHLDTLTQSLFLDMFGDPVENEKSVPVCQLQALCNRITDGTHQSPDWVDEGIPFLFISNIVDGSITFDTHKFISEKTYFELTRRCPIEIDDVLYTTVGSYGNAAVVTDDKRFAFQRHIAHIKPDRSKTNSLFLAAMIQSVGVRRQVDKVAKGVAQKTVNLADLKGLTVFAPPLPLQQAFATRIQAIEALKATHRAALAQLDALFASLQQRAFAGEL